MRSRAGCAALRADCAQTADELVVTPTEKVKAGKKAHVVVTYGGTTAEEVSGADLEDFFQVWLYTPEKPTVG